MRYTMEIEEEVVEAAINKNTRGMDQFWLLLVPSIPGDIDPHESTVPPELSPEVPSFALR